MKFAYFLISRGEEEVVLFDSFEECINSARAAYNQLARSDQQKIEWLYCAYLPDYDENDPNYCMDSGKYAYYDLLFELNNKKRRRRR